jgi:cobalamin biosynthesis protein CobT
MTMTRSDFNIIKDLLNWIEDRRIDYYIYTTAPGYRAYYEAMYNKYFNDKVIDKALQQHEKTEETWDDYMFHVINFTNPNRQLDELVALRKIWSLIDLKNIARLTSTTDCLLVALEVYKEIKKAVAAAQPQAGNSNNTQQQTGAGSGFGSGESDDESESDESESDESESDEETDGSEDSESKSSLTDKELKKLNEVIEKQKDFLNGDTKKTGRVTKQQSHIINAMRESGTEIRSIATNEAGTSDIIDTIVIKKLTPGIIQSLPHLFNGVVYVDGSRNYQRDLENNSYNVRNVRETDEAVTKGIILGKQLGRKLQIRDSERSLKSTRLQSGKIDRRLISQLGYDNVNVFHRIVTDRFKNYFIHISIDASGSMSGRKFSNAIASAVAVAQAASMTTGIRVQISLRGTSNINSNKERCVTVYAYDSAHDKMSKIRNMFKYLTTFGCTPEGLSFKSIESDIRKDAKGDECIFINYSDGEPTTVSGCAYRYNGVEFTRKVINTYRELGINIISYFIYDSGYLSDSSRRSFKTMYGADAQFINPTNMNEVSKTVNAKFLELAE